MPRKCVLPSSQIAEIIEAHKELFQEHTDVPIKSDGVWRKLADKIRDIYPVKPEIVYLWVKTNRYNFREVIFGREDEVINDTEMENSFSNSSGSISSRISSRESLSDGPKDQKIIFEISLSNEEWKQMSPETVFHKSGHSIRKRNKLKRRTWSNIIAEKFYEKTTLPCCLLFKKNKISESGIFATIYAKCRYCYSSLMGTIEEKPIPGSDVLMKCTFTGCYKIKHPPLKRFLSGNVRREAVLGMKVQSATTFQKENAHKYMQGDNIPAHIPNLNTLRTAKWESKKKEYLDKNEIVSLAISKCHYPYRGVIQDVGFDPFFVHYYGSQQMHLYNSFMKKEEAAQISIDATGGIVRRFTKTNGEKCHTILLYDVTLHDRVNRKVYSVSNMLSERHDTSAITYWLTSWRRFGADVPKVVVCDMSLALMAAAVKSFTRFNTLNEYLKECALILDECTITRFVKPETYLRNDVAHLIKLMTTWKCLKTVMKRTKQFFLKSLCLALQATDLCELRNILKGEFHL